MRLALLLGLLLMQPLRALSPPPPYFENAAQDATGVIWAYSRSEYNQIYRFDGKEWSSLGRVFTSEQNAMPALVVRMSDGTVACIWRLENHQVGVTIQSGRTVRLLGTCDGEISQSGLTVQPFADSQNRLWITGESGEIYRASEKEGVVLVHKMTPEEYVRPARDGRNRVHAVEDGHGRIWVWSNPQASNYTSLRGVLIFTGDKAEMHDSFGTIKGRLILAVARADDKHMWVSVCGDGLYRVDIDSFAIEREPDPEPKAFIGVNEFYNDGDDIYAVAKLTFLTDTLWRKKAGQWKRLMPQLDAHPFSFLPRSWLPVKEGMLVESYQAGPWFIAPNGDAAQFSWRTGFPLENVHALARFSDETFFCLGANAQIFHGPLTLPPQEKPETARAIQLDTNHNWVIDPAGHLWIATQDKPPMLKEWDGTQWIPHSIPGVKNQTIIGNLMADAQDRIWPFWGGSEQALTIWDIHAQKWLTFANLQAAFIALAKKPPLFLNDEWFLTPQYSADHKRVAYRESVVQICYYNGTGWKSWSRSEIMGQNSDNAVGVPWFDAKGKLRVNLRQKMSWIFDGAGKWSQLPFESHFPTDIWSEGPNQRKRPVPPEGAVTKQTDSIAVDNLGVTWMQWKNQLYKCIPGTCVPVFGEDEITPFSVPRLLQEVVIDKSGNAFVRTASGELGWFMIKPKSPAPHTTLGVQPPPGDSVRVLLDAHSTAPIKFHWQLDQNPEQITTDTTLNLNFLPNGPHVLSVAAWDDELQSDRVPAVTKFKIHINAKEQLAGLIAHLSDADYDVRKAAIQGLAMQPASALSALRKARLKADDSTRWWIDAALQEIESREAPKPSSS